MLVTVTVVLFCTLFIYIILRNVKLSSKKYSIGEKIFVIIVLCAFLVGIYQTIKLSIPRSQEHYQLVYRKFVADYDKIENILRIKLNNNDSIYQYAVGYTGKRLFEDIYISESERGYFPNSNLTIEEEDFFHDFMYSQDVECVNAYRDSIVFVYTGYNNDKILKYYNSTYYLPKGSVSIGKNVVLLRSKSSAP